MNLPNAITVGRILVAPLIAALPFINSPFARLAAFLVYIIAAISDYYDGMLARTRNLITDLGSLLDPLADKLLLFATLIPMFVLMLASSRIFTQFAANRIAKRVASTGDWKQATSSSKAWLQANTRSTPGKK